MLYLFATDELTLTHVTCSLHFLPIPNPNQANKRNFSLI